MSDIKVVAFKSDIDELGRAIKKRSKANYDLVFPNDFVTEIAKIQDYLEDYLTGELREYSSDEKYLPEYLFYYYDSIEEVSFPNVISIGEKAFQYCSNLRKVNLPKVKTLPEHIFQGCTSLQNFDFSNITIIDSSAFSGCPITEVNLPKITRLNNSCFSGCSNLVKVVIRQNTSVCTLSSTNVFNSTPIANGEGFIYVPDELLEDYKVATNWSTYADQIKPLSELTEG